MAKKSKRYRQCLEKVDKDRTYDLEDAVQLVKSMATAGFDETVELCVELGIEASRGDQQVRGNMALPHGLGKERSVAVFASGESALEAEEAGADYVGDDDLIERVEDGWMDFDVALATPDMMSKIGRLGRFLGPQGLMPSPKSGTVTDDIGTAVKEFKAGRVEFRNDDGGNVHMPMGKVSFGSQELVENVEAALDELVSLRPLGAKGRYLKKVTLSSTMSPGVKVEV